MRKRNKDKIYNHTISINYSDKEHIYKYKYIDDKLYFIGRRATIYTSNTVTKDFEDDCNSFYVKGNVLYKFEIGKQEIIEIESKMNPVEEIKENYLKYSKHFL
jgi:hypothetical protein